MSARYAIYFAPARHSPWWEFGTQWLGRDEYDSRARPQSALEDFLPPELSRLTEEPRRYGFHATLKAPFRLAEGRDEAGLITRLAALAPRLKPVALGPLHAATLGDFVALVPDTVSASLHTLAAACVTELDDVRAPLLDADRRRRGTEHLDPREVELLNRYGYPYVLERFRFHLTLTGRLEVAVAKRVTHAVAPRIALLNAEVPLVLDRLCLFVEKAPGAPFQRIRDVPLAA